jgi:nitrogen fixation protein FixH
MSAVMSADRPRGRWIPWLFVGGFLLVCAVNGVMIWVALSSWTGLAANQPYDRGLAYNRNLAAAARLA